MGLVLFEHNGNAYKKAVCMLEERGRAAVIHPTGTGKSFIGFKLCFDNPDRRVCWLSPSEYIFRTQVENLQRVSGGHKPDNISFFTYARLVNMSDGELALILPDYIVLDEFHRCGAKVWELGMEKLLSLYGDVPVLGLSATAVRYLDNRRDMADELFGGNIASEMTLGEAIVKGILKPPKYVLSAYSYRESLNKYEKNIRKLRYKKQRDKADKYLEALRRALDKAEGLDVIFDRHIADRTGKYIIFCSDYGTMREAMEKTGEWFHLVDNNPHVYSLYSGDKKAGASFRAFKDDSDGGHLRLLYCIDALNEGVHVEDISGVVLLRPTVSPIVYKQQIGRALSAGKETDTVIFDIVGNIENLYGIDVIREEMETALDYIRRDGDGSPVVSERFEVIGELHDCLELFRKLEGVLSSSWDVMYLEAKLYYGQHGDLLMTRRYISDAGYPLGRWVYTQRMNRRKGDGSISRERIEKLDAIGMDWQYANERSWKNGYRAAKQFYEEHGHLDIPAAYDTDDGFHLGVWCRRIRVKYREGRLFDSEIKALEQIGMEWESVLTRKWMHYYGHARRYFEENGNLAVPLNYISEDGVRLGVWISSQREGYSKGRLPTRQKGMLEEIGMSWDRFGSKWERGFSCAVRYKEKYGDINAVPESFNEDGVKLLSWIRVQRGRYNSGKLASDRIARLETIGIVWRPHEAMWEKGYAHAVRFAEEHGSLSVPARYVCGDGYKLKSWLNNQVTRYRDGRMTDEQREKLENIGMVWGAWEKRTG